METGLTWAEGGPAAPKLRAESDWREHFPHCSIDFYERTPESSRPDTSGYGSEASGRRVPSLWSAGASYENSFAFEQARNPIFFEVNGLADEDVFDHDVADLRQTYWLCMR
jgi:hypothetical protein